MRSKLTIAAKRKLNWGRSDWYWGLSANRAQNLPQQTVGLNGPYLRDINLSK